MAKAAHARGAWLRFFNALGRGRDHLLIRYWLESGNPLLLTKKSKKSLTLASKLVVVSDATKLYTCIAPFMPDHKSQLPPPTETWPWDEPIGETSYLANL